MAGAAGYVLKQIHGSDLVGAVRTVAAGQSMLDPQATGKLMARLRGQPKKNDPLASLSPQERRILELIGEGLTNRQIGEGMFLAEKTVKNYVSGLVWAAALMWIGMPASLGVLTWVGHTRMTNASRGFHQRRRGDQDARGRPRWPR